MGHRLERLASEAVKFLTVGGLATLVSFVLFNALVHGINRPGPMHQDPLVAFIVANTVGMVVSYRGSRSWAFQGRQAVGVTVVRFWAIRRFIFVRPAVTEAPAVAELALDGLPASALSPLPRQHRTDQRSPRWGSEPQDEPRACLR